MACLGHVGDRPGFSWLGRLGRSTVGTFYQKAKERSSDRTLALLNLR